MIELSQFAGFSLQFDPATLAIETGDGVAFQRIPRTARELIPVLRNPEAANPEEPVYEVTRLAASPTAVQALLDCYHLTYTLVLIPPSRIGGEFAKTAGHYHPAIPGTSLGYPEVYTQLYGRLLLLLQERLSPQSEQITDVQLVEMTPGFTLTIPPNYAHVLINTTTEPALMAGLYGIDFSPDYRLTNQRRGLAYYLVEGEDGQPVVEANPAYADAPPLQRLENLFGSPFEPPDPGRPVWSAFLANPEKYAFLTQADAARQKFLEKI